MKKVFKNKTIVFPLILVIAATCFTFSFFYTKGDINRFPSIFTYKPLTILSNSMEPTVHAGDLILIDVRKEPEVNEVVTYKHPDGILITHRIIEKMKKDGETFFKTKGDNNNTADDFVVPRSAVIGVEQFVIPNAGYIVNFVSGPIGFFIVCVVPLLIVINYEIFKWLGLIGQKKKQLSK